MKNSVRWGATVLLVLCLTFPAPLTFARERSASGTYSGRRGSGTVEKNVSRNKGSSAKTTTWQNERGEGSSESSRSWNKETKTGTYSSRATGAGGRTVSSEGTFSRNEDGSLSQQGAVTGSKGKTADVSRTVSKNEDGSRDVQAVYTDESGKSSTVSSTVSHQNGEIVADRTLTGQDGNTWTQHSEVAKEGDTVSREVTNSNPEGEAHSYNQSFTFGEPAETEVPANE